MKTLLLLALLLLAPACASTPKVTALSDLPSLAPTTSGLALPVTMESTDPVTGTDGCTAILYKDGELREINIKIPPGKDVLFAELPPGIYGFKEAFCSAQRWNLGRRHWPRFQVYAGKISVLSGVSISIDKRDTMSAHLSNRSKNRDETLHLLGRLPVGDRERVVSAYTGAQITPASIDKPARWKDWELTENGKKNTDKNMNWPTFRTCYRGEGDVNPLWLGGLKIDATYDKGSWVRSETSAESWSTFTPHFKECVEAALKEFHPLHATHLKYTLYI